MILDQREVLASRRLLLNQIKIFSYDPPQSISAAMVDLTSSTVRVLSVKIDLTY